MRSLAGPSLPSAVTIRVADDALADIDGEAKKRTQCNLNATQTALFRLTRERLDEEVGRLLCEDAEENLT